MGQPAALLSIRSQHQLVAQDRVHRDVKHVRFVGFEHPPRMVQHCPVKPDLPHVLGRVGTLILPRRFAVPFPVAVYQIREVQRWIVIDIHVDPGCFVDDRKLSHHKLAKPLPLFIRVVVARRSYSAIILVSQMGLGASWRHD